MLSEKVFAHFGSRAATGRALGLSQAAVYQWGELVPPLRAAQIEKITAGKLKFDPSLYGDYNKPSAEPVNANNAA